MEEIKIIFSIKLLFVFINFINYQKSWQTKKKELNQRKTLKTKTRMKTRERAEPEKNVKDKDSDEDKGPGICFTIGQKIFEFVKAVYIAITWFFGTIFEGFNHCWYPTKERMNDMCDCCGKRMSQHTDPAYRTFDI